MDIFEHMQFALLLRNRLLERVEHYFSSEDSGKTQHFVRPELIAQLSLCF